ncbi:winged helix-turn-helix domain-containing protein [Haloplanus halophilus]|uniref:winged helix-turn-helix domain-containing protein n=1 Tax=Haloplanus halophilus TaxID=2949993 RepID=UPI00203E77C1|nr:helix-turn-helix domain-containing protein [Haloplanus sp. GDY1]
MSEGPSTEELFALLDDEYARAILTRTSIEPMSAKTLSDRCDASLPTIYRRTERLVDCDLLAERTEIGEDGHHYSVFEARLDSLTVELDEGDLSVTVEAEATEDPADRFTDLWEGI